MQGIIEYYLVCMYFAVPTWQVKIVDVDRLAKEGQGNRFLQSHLILSVQNRHVLLPE